MIYYNKEGKVTTAASTSYYLGEQKPVDLQRENDILKQRCAFHSSPEVCGFCPFKCVYRKK